MILALAGSAYGHPGKTDRYGGHRCLQGCGGWELYYNEYHLHDDHGRPIHVRKKQPRQGKIKATDVAGEMTATAPAVTEPATTAVLPSSPAISFRTAPVLQEQADRGFDPLLLVLAILLLLLLVVRIHRREQG